MSKFGPASAFLYVGGKNLSGDHYQLDENIESMLEQTNGLGASWEAHLPVGLAKVSLDAGGGIYDNRSDGPNAAFAGLGATRQLVSWGTDGIAIGDQVGMADGTYASTYKREAQRAGLTKASAVHTIHGKMYRGRILNNASLSGSSGQTASIENSASPHLPTPAITSSSIAAASVITVPVAHGLATGDVVLIAGHSGSTPTINGYRIVTVTGTLTFTIPVNVTTGGTGGTFLKASSDAPVVDLHVLALTLGGYTSVTILVKHSVDDSVWLTAGTFTNVTTVGASERLTLGSQIARYRSITYAFNGSGSGQSIIPYVAISHT